VWRVVLQPRGMPSDVRTTGACAARLQTWTLSQRLLCSRPESSAARARSCMQTSFYPGFLAALPPPAATAASEVGRGSTQLTYRRCVAASRSERGAVRAILSLVHD
jgi:hypothetical protein